MEFKTGLCSTRGPSPCTRMLLQAWQLVSQSFTIWSRANASRMSAALTYYTMLSLAPLLMIAIAIASYVFDSASVKGEVIRQVKLVTTPTIAESVGGLIERSTTPGSGFIAGSISLFVLTFGASGVFTQLYEAFNDIWNVPRNTRRGFLFTIQKRLLGVGMVLVVGLALLAALILNSVLGYLNSLFEGTYPSLVIWLSLADRSLSFLLMPLVFALVFWFVPATKIKFRDVWPAGVLTAVLIACSRYLIAFYLQFSTTSEVYGVSGSFVVLLVYVYIAAMIVFFGASFSHAWARTFGSRKDWTDAEDEANRQLNADTDEDEDSQSGESSANRIRAARAQRLRELVGASSFARSRTSGTRDDDSAIERDSGIDSPRIGH